MKGWDLLSERLAALGHKQVLQSGETLCEAGDDAHRLFEIVAGVVKLSNLLKDGRCQIIGLLYPGQLIGLACSDYYAYTAEALGVVAIRRYDKELFETVLDNEPALRRRLVSNVSDELRAAQDHMLLLGRKTALERVASFLRTLSERVPQGEAVELPMSRQDMADYLGLTIETVCRTLGHLKANGVVRFVTSRRLSIQRWGDLTDIADGDRDLAGVGRRTDRGQRAA